MPWISVWCKPSGEVYPCCAANMQAPSELGHLGRENLKDVFNGERIKELRRLFRSGKLDENVCAKCISREKVQGESLRTLMDKKFGRLAAELLGRTDDDGTFEDFKLLFVDFVWSNKCNFKCVHCTPVVSSALATIPEFREFYAYHNDKMEQLTAVNGGVLDEFMSKLDSIDTIHFNGGEPFVIEEHFQILEHLIKIGRTDARLWFHTNGSTLGPPQKNILDYLKHFKNVRVSFSQDGIGERGGYVRHGYSDEKFIKHVRTLKEVVQQVSFGVCAHGLNVWHLTDILDWHLDHGTLDLKDPNLGINVIVDPQFIRYDVHDEATRTAAADRISEWLPRRKAHIPASIVQRLESVTAGLRRDSAVVTADWERFKNYLDIKNSVLKQDARVVFPEYGEFFDKVGYA